MPEGCARACARAEAGPDAGAAGNPAKHAQRRNAAAAEDGGVAEADYVGGCSDDEARGNW